MVSAHRGHYLRENKGGAKPSRILFFDVETTLTPTDPIRTTHSFRLAWSLYWKRQSDPAHDTHDWRYHPTAASLWDEIEARTEKSQPLCAVAHNLNYDLGVLGWDRDLTRRGWTIGRMYVKGCTTILKLSKEGSRLIFVDNMNWFKCSVATLGSIVGLPKLDTDPLTANDADVSDYCKRDVNIMYRAWQTWFDFLDQHHLGNWGVTLPSQAMNAYKHRFMKTPLLVHANVEATEIERAAYHGGRTSVFWRGALEGVPVHKLDLNSAYPWAMATVPMPSRLLFLSHTVSIEELRDWLVSKCVIAELDLTTDANPYPVAHRGHNVYPVGAFRTTLTTEELSLAIARGWIHAVVRAAVYERKMIFSRYVKYFYGLKRQYQATGNEVYAYLVKLMLNGLYGKFGQTGSEFVRYGPVDEVCDGPMTVMSPGTGQARVLYRFGDTLYTEEDTGETNSSIPSIAAHVTAAVRLRLFALRERAGARDTYYCDTDSLFVSSEGAARLSREVHPTRLGALKEEDVTDRLTILSPKTYLWADHWTRKGIPSKAEEVAPHIFAFTKFPSLRGLARRATDSPYYTEHTTRKLNYTIYDGKPGADGWVVPLNASELTPPEHPTPEVAQRLWEIKVELEASREAKTLPQEVVFKIWDYRTGATRSGRTLSGALVPLEYSDWDSRATELGYPDLDALLDDVERHVDLDEEIARLTSERRYLLALHPPAPPRNETLAEMPF